MTKEANCGSLTCVNSRTNVMLGRSTSCSCSWSLSSPPPPWLRTRYVDSSPISLLHLYLGRSEVSLQISFLLEITFWTLERLYIFIFSRAVSSASSGWTERVSAPGATELTPSHQLEPHPYGPWLRCWRGVTGLEVPVPSQDENGVITTGTLNFWSLDCLYNFIFLVLGASFQRSKPRSTSTFSRE